MELEKIAQDAIGATLHVVVKCYRCTREQTIAGVSEADCIKKAVRAGWRKVSDRLTCKKCSK